MYETVFSVEEQPLTDILIPLAAFVVMIIAFNLWARRRTVAGWIRVAGTATLGLVGLVVIAVTYKDIQDSQAWAKAVAAGRCSSYEGVVQVLQREQPHGQQEKVHIGGKVFEFSFSNRGASYRATLAHGGVLDDGVKARVCVVGGRIVRIDLKRDM